MGMRKYLTLRNFLILLITALILGGIIYYLTNREQEEVLVVPEPQTLSSEDELEKSLRFQIPEDAEKTELRNLRGDASKAIATRRVVNEVLEISILADLDEGSYQAYLVKGEQGSEDYSEIPAGELRLAKGGYLLEFESSEDLSAYDKIIVKDGDNVVFEGSF